MLIHGQAGQMEVPQHIAVDLYGRNFKISCHNLGYLKPRVFQDNFPL
jgi:hypothetical protein